MELTSPQLRALRTVLGRAQADLLTATSEYGWDWVDHTQLKAIDRWLRLIDKQTSKQEETQCSSDGSRS